MIVTAKAMSSYRLKLAAISEKAADEALKFIQQNNYNIDKSFIDFAHGLTTKYGDAAATLSCQMYDEMHEYWKAASKSKKAIKPAVPAEVPTRSEVEKAVYGTLKSSVKEIPGAVSRMVKQTAEDTKIKNGKRDRAEFAWVPGGDSCAFCIAIAAEGWQPASSLSLNDGHAEHIHANCTCTYAVRFDKSTNIAGYDPSKYRAMYDAGLNAPYINEDIDHPQPKAKSQQKLNGLRRMLENDEKIGKYTTR